MSVAFLSETARMRLLLSGPAHTQRPSRGQPGAASESLLREGYAALVKLSFSRGSCGRDGGAMRAEGGLADVSAESRTRSASQLEPRTRNKHGNHRYRRLNRGEGLRASRPGQPAGRQGRHADRHARNVQSRASSLQPLKASLAL